MTETPQEIGNRVVHDMKAARQMLVDAKKIMEQVDAPLATEVHLVVVKLEKGLAQVLLARELNS